MGELLSSKAKKNKSYMYVSKPPLPFVFRCTFDSAKSKVWIFFACLIFFFSFIWTCSSKYTRKDMTDTMKHFEQQTSSTLCSVFKCLVSCSAKNQVPYFKAVTDSNLTLLLLRRKKKKPLKKNAFRSGLPICHELWDIAFIFFFSLMKLVCLPLFRNKM